MGDAVGQILALAVGVSLSPIPIIGVVLMLATPRGRVNGLAFLLGWVIGLFVVGSIVLLLFGNAAAPDESGAQVGAGWANIVLGVFLLAIARRRLAKRPAPGQQPELPAWTKQIDRFDAPRSSALGFALAAINPKNLLLTISAASLIAQSGIPDGDEFGALVIYAAVATVGPALPVAIYLIAQEQSRARLDSAKRWLGHNNAMIIAVICVLLAANLIGHGISALS